MSRCLACITCLALLGVAQQTAAAGESDKHQDLFVTANVQFTLCHELTHALIYAFDVPVLGREEDAADQISAICFLHPTHENRRDPQAVEKLVAVADAWRLEWELDKDSGDTAYWDEHALDIQRYYYVVCVLYGSDPLRFENLPDQLGLPWQRAWSCADYEYEQIVKAGKWLLETYGVARDPATNPRAGKVRVVYAIPGENKQRAYSILKASALFERKAELMNATFDLPYDIAIVATDCLGEATAYWRQDRREVVFCYDLVERFDLLAKLRRCILGSHTGPANRRPMDPARIRQCLAGIR